jgi:hypothetical protein
LLWVNTVRGTPVRLHSSQPAVVKLIKGHQPAQFALRTNPFRDDESCGYYGSGYYGSYRPVYSSYAYGSGYGHQSSVARLQQQLARAGYYRGPIDGIMGPRTRYALRAYQHDHGAGAYGMTDR